MENRNFGDRLKKAIKNAGTTQRALAGRLSLSESSVSGYIKGDTEPSLDSLDTISKQLNVSLDWLITGQQKKKPHLEIVRESLAEYSGKTIQLTENEATMLGQFRKLKEQKQTDIVMYLAHEVARDEIEKMS